MNPPIRRHTQLRSQCLLRQANLPASRRVAGRAVSARNTRESHNSPCTIVAYPFIPIINPPAEPQAVSISSPSPARPQGTAFGAIGAQSITSPGEMTKANQTCSTSEHTASQPAPGRDEHGTQDADIHKPKNLLCRVPRKGGKRISLRAEWDVLAETGGMVETFDAAVSSSRGGLSRSIPEEGMEKTQARPRPREDPTRRPCFWLTTLSGPHSAERRRAWG